METQGLSVLIPVYNFFIEPLIIDLKKQLDSQIINYELRVYDDFSNHQTKFLNQKISPLPKVFYNELDQNQGRAKIRNLLAKDAQFENLLFLDCDCEPASASYISIYSSFILKNNFEAINGGRKYKPFDFYGKEKKLHWVAGKTKEEKSAETRSKQPYGSFMLDNLLIKKDIFLGILLDENIKTYGHEDTKFGFELEKREISVLHIDNPTYHIGLSPAEEYLEKSKLAVIVLCQIVEKEGIGTSTSLYKMYDLLRKLKLRRIFLSVLMTFEKPIIKNLTSKKPSILFFDLYKLKFMLQYFSK